ncbi:MAG: nucleotidyl transferase AbiEii/AbiGii toxin family protein [Candidatus Berkelbacteria bacterium]|nr:nucleotidyl transferase AbiEii/AbiGii toxin family protein [Candidatus Berkelbacteria bacterium]MCR4307809.1 nucleotidyl transferase AbiEii/AbiGii toxin family protein [Candidatus Berkelbacteria bacterium]
MISTILTERQKQFLRLLAKQKNLVSQFYLSGGTALTEYYIPYRYSEDLDFFSLEPVDTEAIAVFLRSIKDQLGYEKVESNTSFNRNLFFLSFADEKLKTEFTYFPFPPIEEPALKDAIRIDSLIDIATNKLFTIYQNPRARDFTDLFMICRKENFEINDLVKKARAKFDWQIDPIKLGSQFLLVKELKDYPRLIEKLKPSEWEKFFLNEARKLGSEIVN